MEFFDEEHKILLHFKKNNITNNFWDIHWSKNRADLRKIVLNFTPKSLVCIITQKFLCPEEGPILEGGCGIGDKVYSLKKLNYDVIGIDNAIKTIENVKKEIPEINVKIGDIRNLPFPDNHFAGYWSLGVIEHFYGGYIEILSEMKRVLKPKGFLFITFPYMSPFRKFKAKIHLYKIFNNAFYNLKKKPKKFYQYILDEEEVINDFKRLGFTPKYEKVLDGIKGFKDEIFFFKFYFKRFLQLLYNTNKPGFLKAFKGILDRILTKFSAHIVLLVFQKY